MPALTRRQQDCFNFIAKYLRENEIPPAVIEIAEGLSITKASVLDLLRALESKGIITRQRYRARTIQIVSETATPPDPILIARLRAWDVKEKKIKLLIREVKKERDNLPLPVQKALDNVAKILFEGEKD